MTTRAIHVVVLAAGRGSRLGTLGEDVPKWLLEVGSRTLAERQLEGIEAAAEHVASVRVVTGHGADAIERFLAARDGRLDVRTLFNPEYADRNNWWSVLLALRDVPADGAPVAIFNADLLAAPSWVGAFLADVAASPAEGLLAVDLERRLTDESMKVELRKDGTLSRIGKIGIDPGAGEYVGMLAARGGVRDAFRGALEAFVDRPEATNEWYEGAVGRTAAGEAAWHVWPMPGSAWVEIDDDADLEAASALVRS